MVETAKAIQTVNLGRVLVGERYLAWLRDPEVTRFLEHAKPCSYGELLRYWKARDEDSIFKGIYVDGEYVGNIKAGPVDARHLHADIGIMIGEKQYWGKGVGTEAIELMVKHCYFEGLHMVTAGIIDGNVGSVKAFLKAGFKEVGRLPQYRKFEGTFRDELLFARQPLFRECSDVLDFSKGIQGYKLEAKYVSNIQSFGGMP